jgi:hypothetical protein
MNLYATLDDLKKLLAVEGAENNKQLFRVLEAASRQIEKPNLTGRYFYCYDGTKLLDGGGSKIWLPEDILSIGTSGLKIDEDGDGTYESTLATTDYILYPLNEYPKIRLETNPNGSYSGFAYGIPKGISITGVFGYGESATPYESRTTLVGNILAGATSLIVADGQLLKTGETIRIDTEQMFVKEIVTNTLTVQRGVNGTTGAAHTSAATVYAYVYPGDITQATLIMAMRMWKRKDSGYLDTVGNPETGYYHIAKGVDPDVLELVEPYRRQEYW